MVKKSRRSRKTNRTRAVQSVQSSPPVVVISEPPETPVTDFAEYRYVITDLRRVAILAGAVFALLVLLSFLIR